MSLQATCSSARSATLARPRAVCGFCGREHIAAEGYLEEGELERFRAKEKEQPDRFLVFDCMSLSIGELDGIVYVEGCPCHRGRRYEDFIWRHRRMIIDYLKGRAADDAKRAKAVTDGLDSLDYHGSEIHGREQSKAAAENAEINR